MIPSAEFVESAVICLYGASNMWLEHLSNPGGEWLARDLEHVGIALLFFGGGLVSLTCFADFANDADSVLLQLGMLIESTRIRNYLIAGIGLTSRGTSRQNATCSKRSWEEPKQWLISMNPMPALVILLLGYMMSGHHQASSVSAMMHAQW